MAESRDRLLSGRYRLIEEIGRGGMGTVWWAYDETEEREVAVKEVHLPPSLRPRERINLIKRTNREAMSAGRLDHPNLIAMYDVVVEDDRPWLVMEYVAARSLEDVFVDDGPISPVRVAEIGRQLLDALRAAHEAGIVHRDVKPSNVLLETSGRVVLTDFGIATYDGATTLTQSGTFMGSPAYVAPEVARGERASPASDLWSLGATLYAAVEGRPPYDFETAMATLSALVTAEPDPPVRAGPLRPLLEGLLQKDAARRLTSERAATLLAASAAPPLPPRPAESSRARSSRRASHEWSSRELSGPRRPGRAQPAPPGLGRSGRSRSVPPDLDRSRRSEPPPPGVDPSQRSEPRPGHDPSRRPEPPPSRDPSQLSQPPPPGHDPSRPSQPPPPGHDPSRPSQPPPPGHDPSQPSQPAPPGHDPSRRSEPTPPGLGPSRRSGRTSPGLDRSGSAQGTPPGFGRSGQNRTRQDRAAGEGTQGGPAERPPARQTAGWLPTPRPEVSEAPGSGSARRRRLLDRPGMLPALTAAVLALAVGAGVFAGLNGWGAGRREAPDGRAPAVGTSAPSTPSAGSSAPPPVSARSQGVLPATLLDASDRPVSRRVAKKSGAWPGTSAITLSVPDHGRRIGVLVVCRSGARRLSFTAYALGAPGRTVSGDCTASGHRITMPAALSLPAGTSRARIRVRLGRGPEATTGPIEWLVGAYESLAR
ncbi:serine/threonine-protein kinase [Actinoallomurus sp. CA-150999]|uniref:serine/threonine-protein kinase n=1 Tax=Actinoallomurus sp. CA-150999 TaxID=3239887 RepID=UPI003D94514F